MSWPRPFVWPKLHVEQASGGLFPEGTFTWGILPLCPVGRWFLVLVPLLPFCYCDKYYGQGNLKKERFIWGLQFQSKNPSLSRQG